MSKLIDLTGKRFGRLVVIKLGEKNERGESCWLCRCDCDKEITVVGYSLKSGNTKSCGCLFREGNNTKHSHNKKGKETGTYKSWRCMIQRCTNPNNLNYQYYGGQGIMVCGEWLEFSNFLKDMGERPPRCTIERINNKRDYYKANCCWATKKQQMRNMKSNHLITAFGKTQCIAVWAEEYNILYDILWDRLCRYGWLPEKALTTPVRKRGKNGRN